MDSDLPPPSNATPVVLRRRLLLGGIAGLLVCVLSVWWLRHTPPVNDARPAPTPPSPPPSITFDVASQLATAREELHRGQRDSAIRRLDDVLRLQATNAAALLLRGQLAREQGEADLAEQLWRRIPDTDAQNAAVARYLESTLAFERRQLSVGERLLQQSKQLDPNFLPTRDRIVRLHVLLLRRDAARQELREIRGLRPWTVVDLAQYRMVSGIIDNPADAIPLLQKYLEVEPDHPDCLRAVLRYLVAAGRVDEAVTFIESLPVATHAEARYCGPIAEVYLKQGDLESAAAVLDGCSSTSESRSWLRAAGLVAAARSDWSLATSSLTSVWEWETDDLEVAYNLGLSLQRMGRAEDGQRFLDVARALDRAFAEAERLLVVTDVRPQQARPIVLEVARLLAGIGRPTESLYWYEQAARWKPDDVVVRTEMDRLATLAASARDGQEPAGLSSGPVGMSAVRQQPAAPEMRTPPEASTLEAVPSPIRLEDEHVAAGLTFQYFTGQSEEKYLLESLGGGVAVLDLDRDGWPDLFFPQGCRLPHDEADREFVNAMYRNRADGMFASVGPFARLDDARYGQGCAAADFNNDGFPDLAVGNYGTLLLYENNGDGTFSEVAEAAGVAQSHWTSSLAWGDLNLDGHLDLYVVNYLLEAEKVCRDSQGTARTCSPENYPAEADVLFLNLGDGRFQDVTHAAGVNGADGRGIGVVIADFDDDGRPDVYVANDGTPNHLYQNLGPSESAPVRFQEVGLASGAALRQDGAAQAGMGIACADLTGDARLDLYVTHFHGDYNTLYRNEGDLLFTDATSPAGLAAPTHDLLGFGTQAVDFDLDGWEDLFVANGHIDDFRDEDIPWKMPAQLFWNRAGGPFVDVSREAGAYFASAQLGRGVARLDWNADGRPDVVVVNQDQPVALLTNRSPSTGRFISLCLSGVEANRSALGARLLVTVGKRQLVRELVGGDGFFATNGPRQIIGIGAEAGAEEVIVVWPGGEQQPLGPIPAGATLHVVQGRRAYRAPPQRPPRD